MCTQKSLEMLPMPLATSHLERGSDWTQSQYSQRARLLMRVFESVLIFTRTLKRMVKTCPTLWVTLVRT